MIDAIRKVHYPIRGLLPPLGLLYLAAVLDDHGIGVKVTDAQALGWDVETTVQDILKVNPKFLGISVLSPFAAIASRVVERIKSVNPSIVTVFGGTHPTVCPERSFLECPNLDAIVVGEGEEAILELTARFNENLGSTTWRSGILVRKTPVVNIQPGEIRDLNSLPIPARKYLQVNHYAPEPYGNRRLPAANIIASRGCTWSKCTYCIRSGGIKRPFRQQSVTRTIEEMRRVIKEHGIREFVFYDEDLFTSIKWLHELCDAVIKLNLRVGWTCRGRANTIDEEAVKHAKAAGLFSIFIGFESGNQVILDQIEKGITLEQSRRAVRICKRNDVETVGSFMLALPNETPIQGDRTIAFARRLNCTYASFQPTYPSEGTPLSAQCRAEGWVYEPRYGSTTRGAKFLPEIRYVPIAYGSQEAVFRKVRLAYRRFYLRPRFVWDRLRTIRNFRDLQRMLHGFAFVAGLV